MNEWNGKEFTSLIENKSSGLLYLYTPLCGTCQVASRMLQVIEKMIDIEVGMMNLNYHSSLAKELAIESVPCLLIIKDGVIMETLYAFHSVPYLLEKIKLYLA